jgi:histidyl-tRNA synthetase
MRVLDCKVESCQPVLAELPVITEMLCEPCSTHFASFRQMLDERKISYTVAPRMVRGLDYYMRTAFEITGGRLGAQNTIVGGGRYDGLSEMLGGSPAKGFGFAFGVERMALSLPDDAASPTQDAPRVFIAYIGDDARRHSFSLARKLREAGISTVVDLEAKRLKKALAVADNLNARYSLIVGDDEIRTGRYVLRNMASGDQVNLGEQELIDRLRREAQEAKNDRSC